jgi:hypothetical protein
LGPPFLQPQSPFEPRSAFSSPPLPPTASPVEASPPAAFCDWAFDWVVSFQFPATAEPDRFEFDWSRSPFEPPRPSFEPHLQPFDSPSQRLSHSLPSFRSKPEKATLVLRGAT